MLNRYRPKHSSTYSPAVSCFLTALILLVCIEPAYAFPDTPMAQVLCIIVDWFSGNLGKGLATIGVSAVAVGAIFGKVSWGLALTVVVGIVVMFGAAEALMQIGVIAEDVCF